MRVLIVNTLFDPIKVGGAEESVRDLATKLRERGHEIAIATQNPELRTSKYQRDDGITVYSWKPEDIWPFDADWEQTSSIRKLGWHLRECRRKAVGAHIKEIIKDYNPTIVNTNNIAGMGPSVWDACQSVPLVHTLRDYYLLCARTTLYRTNRRCASRCTDCRMISSLKAYSSSRKPDGYIAISEFVLDSHRNAGAISSHTASKVIGNAPEVQLGEPRIATEAKRIMFLGRLEPAKGLPVLLRGFRMLDSPNLELHIYGAGRKEDVQVVNDFADADPRITFHGRAPAGEALQQNEIVAIPTQWDEPFGRVASEARRVGNFVIASDVGGLPETLRGYAPSALVQSISDPQAWATAVDSAVSQWEPTTLGRPGGAVGDHIVERYEDFFLEVLQIYKARR